MAADREKFPFNTGPATNPRRLKFYGAFRLGAVNKRWRLRAGAKPIEKGSLWRFLQTLAAKVVGS